MNDLKDMQEPRPEELWTQAEKMLDRHFRNKRILTWSLVLFFAGAVITGSVIGLHNFYGKPNPSNQEMKQTSPASGSIASTMDQAEKVNHDLSSNQGKQVEEKEARNEKVSSQQNDTEAKQVNKTKAERATGNFAKADAETKTTSPNAQHSKPVNSKLQEHIHQNVTLVRPVAENIHPDENISSVTNRPAPQESNPPVKNEPALTLLDPIHPGEVLSGSSDPIAISDSLSTRWPSRRKTAMKMIVYGSAQLNSKTVEAPAYAAYVKRRSGEEQNAFTQSVGAALAVEVKKFSFSAGVEYSSWGEENSYTPYVIKKNVIDDGNWSYRVDTDTAFTMGLVHYNYQNTDSAFNNHSDTIVEHAYSAQVLLANGASKFYYIEFPVEVSYRLMDGRFGIGVSAGASPAWLVSTKGYYLKRDLSGVELLSSTSTHTFILNGRFSLDLFYRLSNRFSLMLRPQYRMNLNSVFRDDYGVNQRYHSSGLVGGVMYSFR